MTMSNVSPQPDDLDKIIRQRILDRAKTISSVVLERIITATNDLDAGEHRAALGALDGVEHQLTTLRCILLLLP